MLGRKAQFTEKIICQKANKGSEDSQTQVHRSN